MPEFCFWVEHDSRSGSVHYYFMVVSNTGGRSLTTVSILQTFPHHNVVPMGLTHCFSEELWRKALQERG